MVQNDYPLIPREAIETVAEWYRRIAITTGECAQVIFYRDTVGGKINGTQINTIPGVHYWTDEIFSYAPKQVNTNIHTNVADTDPWYHVFNRKLGMYVETHSHSSMQAFVSNGDLANGGNESFHLVFGKLNKPQPEMYAWSTMNQITKESLSLDELKSFMDTGESVYDTLTKKLLYRWFLFDEEVFSAWNSQIVKASTEVTND